MKSTNKDNLKLEKKVKDLHKNEKIEKSIIEVDVKVENEINNNLSENRQNFDKAEKDKNGEIIKEKVKKYNFFLIQAETLDCDKKEEITENEKKSNKFNKNSTQAETMDCDEKKEEIKENVKKSKKSNKSLIAAETMDCDENSLIHNAIIANLPNDASKEELINFLSNRGIPVDGLHLNNNKYAIIETNNPDIFTRLTTLLSEKPMPNNTEMKAIKLSGKSEKLSQFTGRNAVANKRVIIVKNIDTKSKIDDVLSLIKNKEEIVKHNSVKVRNRGIKTQMLTIEFKNSGHTDVILTKLNSSVVDGSSLCAEYKYNLVDANSNNKSIVRTDTVIIKNLPLSSDKETVKALITDFSVLPKHIQIARKFGKNTCFIKFNSVAEASKAFVLLKEEVVEGVKLELKYAGEKKEENDTDFCKTRLHITNLPFTAKKEDIEKEFDMADSIKFPLTTSGKSKGCCYLSFSSEEMATLARDGFQDKVISGRKIKCEFAKIKAENDNDNDDNKDGKEKEKTRVRGKKNKQAGTALTLYNLPAGVTVKDITSNFGNVKLVNIVKKGESFKGIAEVHFKDVAAAQAALAAPEFSLKCRPIRKELKGGNWRNGTEQKRTIGKQVKNNNETVKVDGDNNVECAEDMEM